MNSLSKFAKVKIDHTKTILKGEDLVSCEKIKADYEAAYQFYELAKEFVNTHTVANSFFEFEDFHRSIKEKTQEINKKYIEKIIWYFTEKYKITLDVEEVADSIYGKREYNYHDRWRYTDEKLLKKIQLEQIIKPIQEMLGGMTLDEKSEMEMKDNFYEYFCKIYHQKEPRAKLIKNRVELSIGRFHFESTHKGTQFTYNSESIARKLFTGLSFFETGHIEIIPEFSKFVNREPMDMFSETSFNLDKVKAIRFYQNGKSVIKFESDEVASEFYSVMCRGGN